MSKWIEEKEEIMSTRDAGICILCGGDGKNYFNEMCPYCNGTGEWNYPADAYVKNHICQCILLDRKWCPICNKKCHHDSSSSPKCTIDPGYGGDVNLKTNPGPPDRYEVEVEMITG